MKGKVFTFGVGCFIFLGIAFSAYGQNKTVSGTVMDASTNGPLSGVNILVKGTSTGTATDSLGHYSVNVPSLRDSLRFSFIGYQTLTVPINGRTTINITMKPKVFSGQQLVVIGFGGEVKKKFLTGSVTSVTPQQFNKGVVSSVGELISSKVPGLNVTQNSSAPGGGISVRIHGVSSITAGNNPLYVIDGQPISNTGFVAGSSIAPGELQRNPLSTLNPDDIKSISVLKGADAVSIYGTRGANGVILITTKSGQAGKLQIAYNGSGSIQKVAKTLDLLNATQYEKVLNAIQADRGEEPLFTQQQIAQAGIGTNWQNQLLRTATSQNQQLSFSGGSKTTQFYTSLNYFNQNGILITSGIKRYSGRVNITSHRNNFTYGLRLTTSLTQNSYTPIGTGINSAAGIVAAARQVPPTLPARNKDGSFHIIHTVDMNNPLALAKTTSDHSKINRTMANVFAQYDITKGLTARVQFSNDRILSRRDGYIQDVTKLGQQTHGRANINSLQRSDYLLKATLKYEKQINQNNLIHVLAGYTYQRFNGRGYVATAKNFFTDHFGTNNLAAGNPTQNVVGSNRFMHALLSYIGRVRYSYLNKYLFKATIRRDGSSRFGVNNRYGIFPSGGFAWRISDEPFLANSSVLSNLKLRVGYGITGNQEGIANYASLVQLAIAPVIALDENLVNGVKALNLANPNLKWEQTKELNIGLDFGFVNNRLSGTVNYFLKNTSNLLLNLPIPSTTGFGTSLQNVGSTRNRGFGLELQTSNFVGKFSWSTNLNFSTLKNEVTGLGGRPILQGGLRFLSDFEILKKGFPIDAYYGYKVTGIFQSQQEVNNYTYTNSKGETNKIQPNASPGYLKFKDVNNDGKISPADRVVLGSPIPRFTFGFGNQFSYEGWSLNVFFSGKFGSKLLNFNHLDSAYPIGTQRNRQAFVLKRWTPQNHSTKYPSFANPSPTRSINSTTVENNSYVRLQNVQLSYTFPKSLTGFRSISIYVAGQNLVTFTNYDGYNPDLNSLGNSNLRYDDGNYPLARIYTLGVKAKF
jgi:TonB-linked SusC/RagA family outer membrane protein